MNNQPRTLLQPALRACAAVALALTCWTAALADQMLPLPDTTTPVAAVAANGTGTGEMTVSDGTIQLQGTSQALGDYIDENKHQSTVLDYLLPQPLPLGESGNRFGLSVFAAGKDNPYPAPYLRVLFRDANGTVWADNTRMQSLGGVPVTAGFEQVETFPWNANELGRIAPWMLNRADGTIDPPAPPKAPLELAGFRMIMDATNSYTLQLRGLRWLDSVSGADPYWLFTYETDWATRTKSVGDAPLVWESDRMGSTAGARFGFGAEAPGPYVRASDLHLSLGDHRYSLEILAADGWHTAATAQGVWTVTDAQSSQLPIPLLPAATYHLRLAVWTAGAHSPQELYVCYVIVRNKAGVLPSPSEVKANQTLRFTSSNGSNLFGPHSPAVVTISSKQPTGTIDWTVQASDQSVIATGSSAAGAGATIDLAKYRGSGAAFWVTAQLMDDGNVVGIARRTFGIQNAEPITTAAAGGVQKAMAPKGQIARTKCDWNEGSTPIVSQADTVLPEFKIWMNEAKQDNYTTIELAAPWMEVEPLPGVFEWKSMDKLVAQAQSLGLRVTFRITLLYGVVPSYVPREFQQDQFGNANGLWGGSSNLVASPASGALRHGLNSFAEAVAQHFRNSTTVIGYTLSNVFFDHGWLDMPYLNQYVDYSPAMRDFFIQSIKSKYGDSLDAVSKAYGTEYASWDSITPPFPIFAEDAHGRLMPDNRPIWRDWMAAKLGAMLASKTALLTGLRQGDPNCEVGFYADDALPYASDEYIRHDCFVADGSMEMMFPPPLEPYRIRYEPIGKIARTAPLVDVGMTNLLAFNPGWNTFNNYVFPQKTLADFSPTEMEAEKRLVQWFGVIDRLNGAEAVQTGSSAMKPAAFAYSMENLFDIGQHTFAGRTQDFAKPYQFQVGAEKIRTDWVDADDLVGTNLTSRPYVYVQYCADVLKPAVDTALVSYVRGGGRLVVEPTSGFWQEGSTARNVLLKQLGIPQIVPQSNGAQDTNVSSFRGETLAFREQPWLPPVETQPTPWLQNIPRQYLRSYRIASTPAGAHVISTYADGSPAAFTLAVGRGQVLVFCGVVDWLACNGLASGVDAWGRGEASGAGASSDPSLISSEFSKDGTLYLVGRRFIGHDEIARIAAGDSSPSLQVPAPRDCVMPNPGAKQYHVRELLTGADFGTMSGGDLASKGVILSLKPGEGFLLEADPTAATASR